ncbi:5-formyltetrahydrofolate cyclo-ligase [Bifidobacterium leontopitheci]|uniref:5-formyltetrahydrofolate cyclo-ligase n=1 Tax=Bifidobacterium leontopitheci TaxID=2650774 RepID=A0A6I1GH25_9BIFI|nr:5-formyltetrahydrofolate cyclo-ligase [Bifidobacterium leontopitheci]KAB7790915.1 5-formyltetrahydrofolate cyclo-ligase [Bifidobacterium leontopitheci]
MTIAASSSTPATAAPAASDIDLRKRTLRKAAIARRKTVPQSERERAAQSLGRYGAALFALAAPGAGTETGDDEKPGRTAVGNAAAGNTTPDDSTPGNTSLTVAAYVSMGSEIPTLPLLAALLDDGARLLVPRLGSGLDIGWSELPDLTRLHDVTTGGCTRRADAGIARAVTATQTAVARPSHRPQEPDTVTLPAEALLGADLILVPAFAVDGNGTRLGRGGGWYDRALTFRRPDVPVIAVCWPWECAAGPLPRLPHDRPVDGMLTPDGFRMLRRG